MPSWHDYVRPLYNKAAELGFVPRETEFLEVSADAIYQIAGYILPGNYQHWSFGRNYWLQKSDFERGSGKIYETITNTRPCHAYLMDHNPLADQVYVIAHCAGHSAFFDMSPPLRQVREDIDHYLRAASKRFWEYEQEYGVEQVEELIDLAHSLLYHVSPNPEPPTLYSKSQLLASPYDKLVPKKELELKRADNNLRWELANMRAKQGCPCPDLLYYLVKYAPLEAWEKDILGVVREAGLALMPQMRTKVMNEGLAVWLSLKLLQEADLPPELHWANAELHGHIASGSRLYLNPYWLGWRLWEHLADNGVDFHEVAEVCTDLSFISNYVDQDFVKKEKLYTWEGDHGDINIKSRDWKDVREKIISRHNLSKFIPDISIDHRTNSGTLVLKSNGILEQKDARMILKQMAQLWKAPVQLDCTIDGKYITYTEAVSGS